jgi:hypothetical protein
LNASLISAARAAEVCSSELRFLPSTGPPIPRVPGDAVPGDWLLLATRVNNGGLLTPNGDVADGVDVVDDGDANV